MPGWPDDRLQALFGIAHPIVLAPMANTGTVELAIAAARAGALGSIPCATLALAEADAAIAAFRAAGPWPVNVNFFCHRTPAIDEAALAAWRARLAPYYDELGVARDATVATAARAPFDDAWCAWVERVRPEVVSFHFGLPEDALLARVRATGAKVIGSATTVREAVWLAERGCAAVIAQGAEAGGHRGMFLAEDASSQVGTFALVPQIADAVRVPVIAAGGVGDGRGVLAALALGASGVQLGTAYLRCPEVRASQVQRVALAGATDEATAITNVLTGRPARGIVNRAIAELGPLAADVPAFPRAAAALAPLRERAEAGESGAFSTMWAGQAVRFARAESAEAITRGIVRDALDRLAAPELAACLPAELRASRRPAIARISAGLSGAGVYRVGDAHVLKIAAADDEGGAWRARVAMQRAAAAAGVAPAVVHVDEARRAVVSERVADRGFAAYYFPPPTRGDAIARLGAVFRTTHAIPLPAGGAPATDLRGVLARMAAGPIAIPEAARAAIARALADEPVREGAVVTSHNDPNPSNLAWDGARLVLLDWDVAGGNDRFYDLAAVAVFLRMDEPTCHALLDAYGLPARTALPAGFLYHRRFVAALCGTVFLSLAHAGGHAGSLDDVAEDLGALFGKLRTGALDPASGPGQRALGLALLDASARY